MKHRIRLDWSRLLGFDQVAEEKRLAGSQLAKCGIKPQAAVPTPPVGLDHRIGAKPGFKPVSVTPEEHEPAKPGGSVALGHRIGAKIGSKPGFKPALSNLD